MSGCIQCCREIAKQPAEVAAVAAVVAVPLGLITMFVCGILGRVGVLPMARVGARLMIALPISIATILISAYYHGRCRG